MPTVTPLVESRHDGGYIVWETERADHRDPIILLSGAGKVEAGTVLARIAHALTGSIAALGVNSAGNATWSAITVADPAVDGAYTLMFIDATHFRVEDPAATRLATACSA
jgi:hypothetical protein